MATPIPEPYSEQGFWNKLRDHARLAGREVLEQALCDESPFIRCPSQHDGSSSPWACSYRRW